MHRGRDKDREPQCPEREGMILARKKKTERFEDALEKLEKIVDKLEKGDLPLEDALTAFTEGVELVRFCHQKLEEADKKIEILMKEQGEGFSTAPFEDQPSDS